ncbi:MAG: 5-amino-6-(5-phosphoribosylamino)uracil reductase [Aquificae bacterium]|nr:5-amino-6-(5-phosphoribosylamino)uracil reductase [Aquificota bacterium]
MSDRPYTIIASEVSVDGKLTLHRGASSKELMTLMDLEAYKYLHQIRAKVDAIMVGCETVRTDNPSLTVRYVEGKNPVRVIPCGSGRIPLDANVFSKDAETWILTTPKMPEETKRAIEEKGHKVFVFEGDRLDFKEIWRFLREKGIRSILVEGGSTVNWQLVKNNLVDEIRLIHLPVVVGGEDVPTLVGGEGFGSLSRLLHLRLRSHFTRGRQLITEWEVVKDKRS